MNRLLTILALIIFNLNCINIVLAQDTLMLSGTILNDAKEPISQVTVNIPGSSPVYTGEDGTFKIARVNNEEWLYITPIDKYSSKKVLLTTQNKITIYLSKLDVPSSYAKVLTPLDNKDSRDIISSFKVLDPKKFENNPYVSAEQYMQGAVSGAFVTQSSGMPGSGANVYIRGYSSILSNNQPLYIVDGIPVEDGNIYEGLLEGNRFSPISTIDPLDISEITVLKDAAATAIYGAKGANGVVIIKTLEPKETKTTINFLVRSGITLAPEQLPQLNAKSYKTLANEVLFSSGMAEENYKLRYSGLFLTPSEDGYVRYNHDMNWQDEVFNSGLMNNISFSLKGGDAIAKYGLSVGYLNNQGIIRNSSYERINIRLIGTFEIFSWLSMDVSSSLTTTNAFLEESGLSPVSNPILSSLWKSPLLNPFEYDDDGNRIAVIDEVDALGTSNPSAIVSLSDAQAKNYRFMTAATLNGDISNTLKFNSIVGLNSSSSKEYLFIPDRGFDYLYSGEVFNESKGQNNNLFAVYNDNRIYYMNTFNRKHSLYGAIGLRWQTNQYNEDYGLARNTASDFFTNLNRGNNLYNVIGGKNRVWNWGALYSNLSYAYADKYLLSASLSSDVSSRIGKNALNTLKIGDMPVGIFYSVAGAWRISNESFLLNVDEIEELKLRLSYGITGNDDIGEVNGFSHYIVRQYRNTSSLVPGGLANDKLTFQTKKQFNVGLDLSLLANRFNITLNYFDNKSENVVILELQNSYLGYDTYPNNSASFSTRGFEVDAFTRIISASNFTFDLGFNISKYNTIIDKIATGQQILNGPGEMQIINREGEAMNSFYGYRFEGVYASAEEAAQANMYNSTNLPYGAGDAKFENVADNNGIYDNVIDKNDKQLLGSFEPDFFGGLSLNSRYRNISLSVFLQGVYGNEVYNYLRRKNESMTGLENQSVKTLQRWQYDGQETTIPKATWADPVGNNDFSDRWIEDGSYMRLKNITLSYNFRQRFLGLSSLKIYATATNLFTLSKYLGYDPEFSYSQDIFVQGVDYANTPISRQFMFGVKLGL